MNVVVRRISQFLISLALGLAVLASATAAHADASPEMRAAAAALFEEARRLMADGKHAEACPKLEESQRIDPGIGTLFNLAVCFEATGRTASAWVNFLDVAGLARAAGQVEREKIATARVQALAPKLMRLKISAAREPELRIRRDGVLLASASLGVPLPVDPGEHKIEASAPGKETWVTTVRLDQPGATLAVDIPALSAAAPSAATGQPTSRQASDVPTPAQQGPKERPWQLPLGIGLAVIGAGGMGAGIGIGVLAKSEFDQSKASCTPKCTADALSQRSDAVLKGNVGTGVFFGGATFALAGIIVAATAPRASAPAVGFGLGTVTIRGAF
jgi:hypothetical protein